ncbi:MAG: VOC family protein [Planctomycetaceae bacterium]
MQNIGLCLWFDDQAEEAAEFYVSIFKNSKIVSTAYYVEGLPKPAGSVMTVRFVLDGLEFVALNGGPDFKFTPALSITVNCDTQAEVDELWQKLTAGGQEVQCGWLTDKFGVSWQIVPRTLIEMFAKPDKAASQRATNAMLTMKKLDIAELQRAYDNA